MAFRVPDFSCCRCCLEPRIELVIWACVNLCFHAVLMCFLIFAMILFSGMGGKSRDLRVDEMLLPSVLLIEIMYNGLVIVACLGKNVKLLKISFALGAVLWVGLVLIGTSAFVQLNSIPQTELPLNQLRADLVIFILLTLLQGYMLLINRSVASKLQDDNRMHGYFDLDKGVEVGMQYGRPIQQVY